MQGLVTMFAGISCGYGRVKTLTYAHMEVNSESSTLNHGRYVSTSLVFLLDSFVENELLQKSTAYFNEWTSTQHTSVWANEIRTRRSSEIKLLDGSRCCTSEQHRSSQKKEKFAFLGFMPKLYYPFPFSPWPCQGRHTQIPAQSRLARNHSGDHYFYYHSEPSWLMKNERRSASMPLLLIYHQLNIGTNAKLFVGSWHHNPSPTQLSLRLRPPERRLQMRTVLRNTGRVKKIGIDEAVELNMRLICTGRSVAVKFKDVIRLSYV